MNWKKKILTLWGDVPLAPDHDVVGVALCFYFGNELAKLFVGAEDDEGEDEIRLTEPRIDELE